MIGTAAAVGRPEAGWNAMVPRSSGLPSSVTVPETGCLGSSSPRPPQPLRTRPQIIRFLIISLSIDRRWGPGWGDAGPGDRACAVLSQLIYLGQAYVNTLANWPEIGVRRRAQPTVRSGARRAVPPNEDFNPGSLPHLLR